MFTRDCPCGSAAAYDACCGPLHRGTSAAESPEQLMRSRFSAYAAGDAGPGSLHERSTFEQRGGRWVYVAALA